MFSHNEKSDNKEENICKWSEQHRINLQNMQQLLQLNIKKKKNKLESAMKK